MYYTRDREAGNIIDKFETEQEALKAIKSYEEEDKRDGSYIPDFYEIFNENGNFKY
jgi:hypothetical protein